MAPPTPPPAAATAVDPHLEERLVSWYRVDRPAPAERPWVLANMVMGVDGAAASGGRVGTLTGPADQALFGALRSMADAVVVGAATVRAERYGPVRIDAATRAARREDGRDEVPRLVVVSGSLRLDWSIGAFADGPPPLVVTTGHAGRDAVTEASRHAEVVVAGEERVDPTRLLALLAERGCRVVLTEGGPTLLGGLVAAGCLDELCLTVAPVIGGDPLPVMVRPPGPATADPRFALEHVRHVDGHVFLRYTCTHPRSEVGAGRDERSEAR
jgi:riboflavin-specific deaminase-like protein